MKWRRIGEQIVAGLTVAAVVALVQVVAGMWTHSPRVASVRELVRAPLEVPAGLVAVGGFLVAVAVYSLGGRAARRATRGSNPHFEGDWWDLAKRDDTEEWRLGSISGDTLFIVVGSHLWPELLDRPVAERLRDHIEKTRGNMAMGRRAVIMTDVGWRQMVDEGENACHDIRSNPVIGVGRDGTRIAPDVQERARPLARDMYAADSMDSPRRTAVWGSRLRTKEAVDLFMHARRDGLAGFLDRVWPE